MNDNIKKKAKNNSSNDLTVINTTNLINKTLQNNKENKRATVKIKTAFKKNKASGDFRINDINFKNYKTGYKFQRMWSSQNIFLYNKGKKSIKNGKILFNNDINIYSASSIYSAPSVKENRIEITKLIKNGKDRRIDYINNIHNNLMIKSSKLYRQKLTACSKDNSFDRKTKNYFKNKYNMKDMNEINKIKINLHPNFKGYFLSKKNKRNFSSNELSLKRYISSNKNKKNINYNDYTLSTNKTNYFSNLFSGKNTMKTIYEKNNNKTNDTNYLINSSKIMSAASASNLKFIKNKKYGYIQKKPLLKNYSYKLLKESAKSENKKENSFRIYKDIEISKMSLELNDIVFNNIKKNNKLNELELKLIKFGILKKFEENRLTVLSKLDINGLKNKITLLQENTKKYNRISFEYFQEINDYLHFLKNKQYTLSNYFDQENRIRFNLYFDIEKLVTDNVLKQKELEHLIEIKLFLIQVKNTLIKQPSYFNDILKEASKKKELAKLIIGLKIQPQNQNVIRFLEAASDFKDEEMTPKAYKSQTKTSIGKTNVIKKKSKKFSQISLLKYKFIDSHIESKYSLFSEKKIFDSPEEFIIIFDNIESKNLRLMKENDYIKRNIDNLQKEYNEMIKSNRTIRNYNDIIQKEEKLKQLKEINLLLIEKNNYLKNMKNSCENITNKNKEKVRTFMMDINILKKITYYKMLRNYKYKGLLLLTRLIEILREFFNINYANYEIDKAYLFVEKNILKKILSINKKNINNINSTDIREYILSLLKLYENICEYIKCKDKEYNSNESNRYIIHKKKEEIQFQRKINNTRTIRQLAEEKRINGIENIIKKNNKPNLLFKGYTDDNIVMRNVIKRNKKLKEMGKNKINYLENEFNCFINYNDN